MKQVQQDGLLYLINEKEEKAKIIGYDESRRNNFIIPRSINHESHEYNVVSISKCAISNLRNNESIQFPSDSELQTIEEDAFIGSSIMSINIPSHTKKICKGAFSHCFKLRRIEIPSISELQTIEEEAFSYSLIESIFIPESLIDLKEGWCSGIIILKTINVDPRNSQYLNYEGKMIICKTSETSENYDKIFFVIKNIKKLTIPSFIKIIGSYSFELCRQLVKIDIPSNSELQVIDKNAFSFATIKKIFIPPHVTKICKKAFNSCEKLQRIDISSNLELQTIDEEAFSHTSIESISIPQNVTNLSISAFNNLKKLHIIEIGEKSEIKLSDLITTFSRETIIMIPVK